MKQASFDLQGHFNIDAFAASLDVLVQRHTALRTNFYSGWKDEPLQVVYRNKRSELYVEDLPGYGGRAAKRVHPRIYEQRQAERL
ncbi:condensation domain-containing protein [Paenibacillus polymyxa]|uniref:condensation domain-containing protein n=1 Tax=Paenibacillus polymyxa TaxID=1406 RepID=UPI000A5CBD55|nr:condensation domain-containing protein [Paenibacillus polymyxa]